MSPPWVLRSMLGTLVVATAGFVWLREPAIDNMRRRQIPDASFLDNLWEAVTAYSHHPDYPAEIEVQPANRQEASSRVFSTDRSTKAL
jgi:hypothetical protein